MWESRGARIAETRRELRRKEADDLRKLTECITECILKSMRSSSRGRALRATAAECHRRQPCRRSSGMGRELHKTQVARDGLVAGGSAGQRQCEGKNSASCRNRSVSYVRSSLASLLPSPSDGRIVGVRWFAGLACIYFDGGHIKRSAVSDHL